MLSFSRPSEAALRAFLVHQSRHPFTYPAVGASARLPPAGFLVDHTRARIGQGHRDYKAACRALEHWDQFRLGWLEAHPLEAGLRVGSMVAVVARALGLWWTNACRITYLIEENGPIARFGFAYGTLPGHVGTGEERFLIEWDRQEDGVWYDILAFSRPYTLLAHLGYPYMRRSQKCFGRDSATAMCRAIHCPA